MQKEAEKGRKYVEFTLNLDGVDYTQSAGFPADCSQEIIEKAFRAWAQGIFMKRTGGADGCEFFLSNIKMNISD